MILTHIVLSLSLSLSFDVFLSDFKKYSHQNRVVVSRLLYKKDFYSLLHIYEEEKRKREEEEEDKEEDVLTARYHHLHHHEYEYQYRASVRVIKICPCDENDDDENDDAQKSRSIDDCDEVVRTTWTTTRRTSSRGRRKNEGDERE